MSVRPAAVRPSVRQSASLSQVDSLSGQERVLNLIIESFWRAMNVPTLAYNKDSMYPIRLCVRAGPPKCSLSDTRWKRAGVAEWRVIEAIRPGRLPPTVDRCQLGEECGANKGFGIVVCCWNGERTFFPSLPPPPPPPPCLRLRSARVSIQCIRRPLVARQAALNALIRQLSYRIDSR